MNNTTNLKTFNYLEDGEIMYSPLASIKTKNILEKGVYNIKWLDNPENRVGLYKEEEKEDIKIYEFKAKKQIDSLFKMFFSKKVKKTINSLGFLHKVGLLLEGKEGTGKTTILKYYYNEAVRNHNAIVFYVDNTHYSLVNLCWEFIEKIRKIQDNPIIVVFEECDVMITDGQCEATLKMILDGNKSIDNCIFLATTNYIDKIPDALKKRKSRFKYCLNIGGLEDITIIIGIMTFMLSGINTDDEIKVLAKDLKGNTLDEVKQFCMDKIMDLGSYDETPNRIGFT